MQHTLEHTGVAARICLFENICLCIYAHIITAHGNLGLQCRQTALSSRIRNKLHRGYALAMVTPPKRCCGSALSPWLPINPSNVVWFLQICSSLTPFCCWMGVLRTCTPCVFILAVWIVNCSAQWNHWSSIPFHMQPWLKWFFFWEHSWIALNLQSIAGFPRKLH